MDYFITNLRYILPPVAGFFIGLITNGLAIFMLFHPYKEKKVLGIRMPFTPGAIPREHKRLAKKIADTICEHLLTSEEILAGFETKEVKEHILQTIVVSIDSMINTDIKSLSSIVPKEWEDDFNGLIEDSVKRVSNEINNILDSDNARDIVRHFVDGEIDRFLDLRIESLFGKEHISKLEAIIKGVVTKIYHSMGLKEKAYSMINLKLDEFIFSNQKVSEVLSSDMLKVIENNVILQTQNLTESLFLKMKKENALGSVEDEIKGKAKFHIKNLRFMPRLIAEMPITNHKIETFLDHFMADLRDEDRISKIDSIVIKKLTVIMSEKLKALFEKEVKEIMLEIPSETIGLVKIEIEKKLYEIFTDKDLEELLIGELDKKIINFEEFEMQKLIPELTTHDVSKIKEFIADTIIHGMRKKETKDVLTSNISAILLERYKTFEIGNLSHILSHGLVENLKKSIFDKSFQTLKEQAPALLKKLDIKMLVERKVEEFPLDELERIVIQIAGAQLRSITLLGGVLGFFIGLLQVLMNVR